MARRGPMTGNRGGGRRKPPPFNAEELLGAVTDNEVAQVWKGMEQELGELERAIREDLELPDPGQGRRVEMSLPSIVRMCVLIRRWVKPVDAAQCADIAPTTLDRWLREGRRPESKPVYKAFRTVFLKARSEGKMLGMAMANVMARGGNLAALKWGLATAFPEDYGPSADKNAVTDITQMPGYTQMVGAYATILMAHVPKENLGAALADLQTANAALVASAKGSDPPDQS